MTDTSAHRPSTDQPADPPPADLLKAIDWAPVGMAVFDRNLKCLAASRRLLEELGAETDGGVAGRTCEEIFAGAPAGWRQVHRRALEEGLELSGEDDLALPGGRPRRVRWSVRPWLDEMGAIAGLVLISEALAQEVAGRLSRETAEARYRAVFDQAAVGVARVSPEGYFLELNDRFCAIAGYAREELMGVGFQQITEPADLEADIMLAEAVLAGEIDTYTVEKRYLTKDHRVVWVNLTASLVRTASGAPDYFVSVIEDITARRRADEALRASEVRFRTLAEISPDAILINKDGLFVYANAAAARIYGLERPEELVGRSPFAFAAPEQVDSIRDQIRRILLGEVIRTAERDIIRPDGARVPIEVSAGPIEWEGGPAIQLLLRDISDHRAAQTAVEESRARAREQLEELEAIYETSPVGLAFLTPELKYVRVNRRLAEMNGVPASAHIGRTVDEVIPGVADQVHGIIQRLNAGECVVSYEVTGETPTAPGTAGAWLEYWRPIRYADGAPRGFNVVVEEITERKQAEDKRKLLVDELNHRVKNTLAVVQSIARQTLAGDGVAPAARAAFEDRLYALASAHNILTRENWKSADLREIVETAVNSQGKGRVTVEGPPVALRPGAAVNLSLALHELATNAAKYGSLSGPAGTVEVGWRVDGGEDPRLRLKWEERGGPPVSPPKRRGFGTRLLERALSAELEGRVQLNFRPEGVVCEIESCAYAEKT